MSIQKRTVFYDNTGGIARFWDWALVTTTIGSMAEPFVVNDRHAMEKSIEYDPTDEIVRVDEIRAHTIDSQQLELSGGQHHLHGGVLVPRVGR